MTSTALLSDMMMPQAPTVSYLCTPCNTAQLSRRDAGRRDTQKRRATDERKKKYGDTHLFIPRTRGQTACLRISSGLVPRPAATRVSRNEARLVTASDSTYHCDRHCDHHPDCMSRFADRPSSLARFHSFPPHGPHLPIDMPSRSPTPVSPGPAESPTPPPLVALWLGWRVLV